MEIIAQLIMLIIPTAFIVWCLVDYWPAAGAAMTKTPEPNWKLTDRDWEMSLEVIEDMRINSKSDRRVIIADWLRKARIEGAKP